MDSNLYEAIDNILNEYEQERHFAVVGALMDLFQASQEQDKPKPAPTKNPLEELLDGLDKANPLPFVPSQPWQGPGWIPGDPPLQPHFNPDRFLTARTNDPLPPGNVWYAGDGSITNQPPTS
jgi:hypothetical protein